jgi:hypothetical protein
MVLLGQVSLVLSTKGPIQERRQDGQRQRTVQNEKDERKGTEDKQRKEVPHFFNLVRGSYKGFITTLFVLFYAQK